MCRCPPGYGGTLCETVTDPCLVYPCHNGGTCTNANITCQSGDGCIPLTADDITCRCQPGYSGMRCEIVTDLCLLFPCRNGGTCTNTNSSSSFVCECGNEFTGLNCERRINHCALSGANCNNGRCVDGVGNYICHCNPGFTGRYCDIEIDECVSARCQNGECEDLVNDYRCLCYPGWTGDLCDSDIDECALDQSIFGPCDNNGTFACQDGNSTYTCTCVFGYTGYNCSEVVNECEPHQCHSGGNCSNLEQCMSLLCIGYSILLH